MRLTHLSIEWEMTTRKLLRNRLALVLLFVIPALFYAIIVATTSEREIPIQLAELAGGDPLVVPQRRSALVFVGLASVGLLTSFLSLNVIQKNGDTNRRLVLAGFRPAELVAAKLGAVLVVVAVVGAYVGAILLALFTPERPFTVILGLVLGGFVYGCYGFLIGALTRRDLVGILFIVLLANIDVGWLQNPIHYAGSPNKLIIRVLPGHYPSQVAMLGAFTDESVVRPALASLAYGAALLAAALVVFARRMRVHRPS